VHDARDFVGAAEPSDRDLRLDLVEHLLGDVLEHLGGDEAGGDGVNGDPDRVFGEFAGLGELVARLARERLSEAEQPDFEAA
jgi:hypothetical protein